ncbi:MAG: hypothetical protein RLZZ618_4231 [Pseudomonadota bacterium]
MNNTLKSMRHRTSWGLADRACGGMHWVRSLACLLWAAILLVGISVPAHATPIGLQGRWSVLSADGSAQPTDKVSATGGRFRYEAEFVLAGAEQHVIDFKNSSVIGRFEHRVTDSQGREVLRARGGLQDTSPNPFFLRHARELTLPPGAYKLVTELESPFFLAHPEPYVDRLDNYRQAIKLGNALVLLCLGVFLGLGLYYVSLALIRRQRVHAMYALFILGNLLYNATALLVARELFGVDWFYLISAPILLSNIAYIVFVIDLLGIRAETTPRLHRVSQLVMGLMVVFVLVSLVKPNWSLEFDRVGVGMFLLFGVVAGVAQAWRGNALARLYLLANAGFFVSGVTAITVLDLEGVFAIYIEHIGLVAVAIEVLLLALVLSYQFGLLEQEKAAALARAENNLRLACTDALTGLPNRYALEIELERLPQVGTLTFVDLDGLKHYNDTYGHASGDQLLRDFSNALSVRLAERATLHRLGGDEFAVTSHAGEVQWIEQHLNDAVAVLLGNGYQFGGASFGSVRAFECVQRDQLKHLADTRMYEHKRRRRVRDRVSGFDQDVA